MANTPTPRSYNRILGDLLDTFLSKLDVQQLKVGSPILSLLEAAAMSDMRSSQDTFDLLAAANSDRATGLALRRIAADEDIEPRAESASSGTVTISDSRIAKVTTKVYQGKPAPIATSASINVTSADAGWPASGQIYIGRGTTNLEGPLTYTSKTSHGSYWTLNLSTPTQRFHNTGEAVTLAQMGNRVIGAGTSPETAQGNASDAIQFSTLYPATIPDGEVSVEGVVVVAKKPGVIGNVPRGAINSFASAPFPGATVTNPLPFSNASEAENDDELRERIKAVRQSRAKGTALAIKTAVVGITSSDENKKVVSASLVRRQGEVTTLYIDDGTGYEERSEGLAIEALNDSSLGGEQFFQLSRRPVAKAFRESANQAPFALVDSAVLSVRVGGLLSEHTFTTNEFRSIVNATAYEVVASINANPDLLFSARTSEGGTRVVVFARAEENEDIEVISSGSATDAAAIMLLPTGRAYSIRLYKNDRLLSKDGEIASLRSISPGSWAALVGTQTLEISVDGTPSQTVSITDADFVNAASGFSAVGPNTLAAWAAVLNYRLPGITATVDAGALLLTSNLGRTARAGIDITGGSLVNNGMFAIGSSVGADRDYTLDRHTGQIHLETALSAGDRIAAGSVNSRAFLESTTISPVTLSEIAKLFVAIDGDAEILLTGITAADTFDITVPTSGVWGSRYRIAQNPTGSVFANAQIGDWLIIWDSGSEWADLQGMWRVVAATDTYVEFEASTIPGVADTGVNFDDVGIALVRYDGQLQQIDIPTGASYTAAAFVEELNSQIAGAEAATYRTSRIRLRTNSFDAAGDIGIVAANTEAAKLGLPTSSAVVNRDSHLGSVETANAEYGTPGFTTQRVATAVGLDGLQPLVDDISYDRHIVGLKNVAIGSIDRFGNNRNFRSTVESIVAGSPDTVTLRDATQHGWVAYDRFYDAAPYALAASDDLVVVADGDTSTKRFAIPMWRQLKPVGTTYGTSNEFQDTGDGTLTPTTLADAFGLEFDFSDFAVFMKARAKTHESDATKSVLWRNKRFGPDGNAARVRYTYPAAASSNLSVSVDNLLSTAPDKTSVSVVLPSDVKKSFPNFRNTTKVGYGYYKGVGTTGMATLSLGFPIASATRVGTTVTLTLTLPTGLYAPTSHGIANGSTIWVASTSPGDFPSGAFPLTAVTANTVAYTQPGAATTVANIGTLSNDPTGAANFLSATPTILAVGDLIRLEDYATIPSNLRGSTIRVAVLGDQFIQGYAERDEGADSLTLAWAAINDTTKVGAYPLKAASCTATAIAAAVNALDAKSPVTATVLGTGGGQVLLSSRESVVVSGSEWTNLKDGVNWVQTTVLPATSADDYAFEFKAPIESTLVSGSDWANETIRLVPMTAKNLVAWMNVPSVSGLFTSVSTLAASQASKLQLASLTAGSEGSIQVQGGNANSAAAPVVGSASSSGAYATVSVKAADATGFQARNWVALDNADVLPKSGIIDEDTELGSITPAGIFQIGPTGIYTSIAYLSSATVQVEKQGKFLSIVGASHADVSEGDYVHIVERTSTPISTTGIFRVVRATSTQFWIEAEGPEESLVGARIEFFTANSLMPGDKISISTDAWGVNNQGTWTVDFVGDPSTDEMFTNNQMFRVSVAAGATSTVGSAQPPLGATEAKKVVITEGSPMRLIKRIHSISPNQTDSTLVDVKFDTSELASSLTAAAGTVVTALDKLAFPTALSQGIDGYRHSTGLIGEATKVVYGEERDPTTYPGVIAAGATINISGPLVRRISVGLAIRARLGVAVSDISDKVKSAVASVVNKTPVGQAVAISDIVNAAARVNGVIAVTVLSPAYGAGNDLIAVQPYEKPLILNVDTDVTVSFVGE